MIMDASGNLFGTTQGDGPDNAGTAFELKPPSTSGGNWSESILWNFGAYSGDGGYPYAGMIMDASGNLFGTTSEGGTEDEASGGWGTVFELTPPSTSGGSWTESILWNFDSYVGDGQFPVADLIMDKKGNLYSTTEEGGAEGEGTVFELAPPSTSGGSWTESILWNFDSYVDDGLSPVADLIMDAQGNLYGTTERGGAYGESYGGYGSVFEISTTSSIGSGVLSLSPHTLSLAAPAGTSTTGIVTITDVGRGNLNGKIGNPGSKVFSITNNGGAYTLEPTVHQDITITFKAPKKTGKTVSSFTITSDDKKHRKVIVKLIGQSQ
jgi:hypothetical protein